jgi:hypothetical protein
MSRIDGCVYVAMCSRIMQFAEIHDTLQVKHVAYRQL